MSATVGEYVDRLCSVELRFKSVPGGLPAGTTHRLYEAARQHQGDPLTYLAAKGLQERVRPGDVVFVITGAGTPPHLPKGETDGPPGAASLALALDLALGAKPVVMAEDHCLPGVVASVEAAGVAVLNEEMFGVRSHCARALTLPYGEETRAFAAAQVERYQPKAMIFVEKGGPNEKGVFHTIMGTAKEPAVIAHAQHFVDLARASGIYTIGIGDGGNEIGFGQIHSAVKDIQPMGHRCACPCGAGVATVTSTDVLVAAAISNWGAYGVSAMLALLSERQEALQDEETELRILEACVREGAQDGAYARQISYVDGTSDRAQQALITLLHQAVSNGLTPLTRNF